MSDAVRAESNRVCGNAHDVDDAAVSRQRGLVFPEA